ncbi:DUF1427 family protein [Dyella psychrodurans]|uniref:DUF1427 family protein n=1 Tax=Dyella psychrodurans TaxID=1927960 RepID=A0A370XDU3_9GAMM|nr:DUF1427 family protein [Dyella psychrodurans]RDS86395.1 DUF1427 family protein [Dyella psychrodurans]
MKAYRVSLAVGAIVGVIYGLLRVKSPAPPTVALVGLFGMLAGEQLIALIRNLLRQLPRGYLSALGLRPRRGLASACAISPCR